MARRDVAHGAGRGGAKKPFPRRPPRKGMTSAGGRRRAVFVLVGLALLALAVEGRAQDAKTSSDETLRVTWQRRDYGVLPSLEGQVQNDSRFWITAVRLRVEGFDASGESVGERSAWTIGNIAPGGRGHFVVPPLPRAATYQITVSGFDRVSAEVPRTSTQSP